MDKYIFPCIFSYDDDGITVTFPDLKGLITCGETDEEALFMATEALELHLFGMEEEKIEIPKATTSRNVKVTENETVQLISVYMPVVREFMNNKSVKKTLTIPKWMDTQIKEIIKIRKQMKNNSKNNTSHQQTCFIHL